MGITKNDVEVLFFTKSTLGVSFTRTLTLGRLQLFITKENIEKLAAIYAPSDQGHFSKVMNSAKYAEPLFELLGADHVESLDFSDYEGATVIHDLNDPIPKQHHNSFSAVVDGGTIEHVFNFPVAIRSCMDCFGDRRCLHWNYTGKQPNGAWILSVQPRTVFQGILT